VLTLCGRLADGVLLANMGRLEAVQGATATIREGEQEAGRAPGSVAVHLRLETCISEDEESALNAMRRRLATRLTNTYPKWEHLEELGIEATDAMRAAAAERKPEAVASLLSDADVRTSTLAGSVEQVAAQLASLMTPAITKVTIRPLTFPGQDLDSVITRFIKDVWPAVLGSNLTLSRKAGEGQGEGASS
jgi:alkanesulfonate monooxygenase SsuD/methylene tetrahydromethanopterin reductase-like flavin-dependent oxidoreductase (luciferase family)